MDSRELINGLIAGIAVPFVAYFLVKGLSYVLGHYILTDFSGFSLKLTCVLAIVANILPFQLFTRQERGRAMQGVVTATLLLIAFVLVYFKDAFFN